MANSAPVTPGQLVQLLLEYGQRVRDIQERAWVYSHPSYVERGLPLLFSAMEQHPQLFNGGSGGDSKAQKEFVRGLAEKASTYVAEVQPLVSSLKIISQNFTSIGQLLAELHRVLGSLTLGSYPDLLHQYMDTFCGAVKAGLLLEDVPRRAVAQMVQLACSHVDKEAAAPLLATAQDPIFSEPSMVVYLQKLFKPSTPRIAQVLELVVGPAMKVADNCEGVAAAGLLEMPIGVDADSSGGVGSRNGSGAGEAETSPAMGMFGMTRRQVYPFLRHREAIRQWGLLGFLVFPELLRQNGSSERLSVLLADGFALHVYKDRIACAHQLVLQHLGPAMNAALGTAASASAGGSFTTSGSGLGGLLGKGMAIIGGGVGRLRKSLTDDSDAPEQPPAPHPLLVDAVCSAVVAAPLQHRMWRAYLIGQLRNIHAACLACPSRIPGQMEMLLAALSLGREELLWFCRHQVRDVPAEMAPIMAARGLLNAGHLRMCTGDDELQALQLLSAMDAMHRILVENHSALCKQIKETIGADLQAHVVTCTPRVEFRLRQAAAQTAAGPTAQSAAAASGLQPFKDLSDILRSVLLISSPPPDAAARVSSACGIWMYVSLQLASIDPPIKAAKVLQYAEDTRYLDVLQKSLDAARLLYEGPLLHFSAADLAPGLYHCVEPLLDAARRSLASGRSDNMQAALGAMQGLHWLLPARTEAYTAATGGVTSSALLLQRVSTGNGGASNGGASRHPSNDGGSSAGQQGGLLSRSASNRRLQPLQPEDLPHRCMDIVVSCLRQQLDPVVKAPLHMASARFDFAVVSNANLLENPANGGNVQSRTASGNSLAKAIAPRVSGGGSAGRSLTPERLRGDSGASAAQHHRRLSLDETEGLASRAVPQRAPVPRDASTLPAAADLAAKLMPLVLALDNGRMLHANDGHSSRAGDALMQCRTQLVEAIRDNFSQLLSTTASAITQVAVPVPSVQLAPLRRFVEVVSMLQPHLVSELLPELARLLLQQTSAPTLQTIGLDATFLAGGVRPGAPPPSTSAEVAASTQTQKAEIANPLLHSSLATRGASIISAASSGGGTLGPMGRSLSINAPAPSIRNGTGIEQNQNFSPMTAALSASGGGSSNGSGAAGAPSTVLRAIHSWLWSHVVLDERRQGVFYDAEAGAFAADTTEPRTTPSALTAATSVRELSLLFELFGPCAAADLARGSEQVIHSCLEQLQAYLNTNALPLQELLDASHLPLDKRLAAVQHALPALTSPPSAAPGSRGPQSLSPLVDALLRLGRCIMLRMQLGRAAEAAADRAADFITLALREMAAPIAVSDGFEVSADGGADSGSHAGSIVADADRRQWHALVRLAFKGVGSTESSYGGCLLPCRDDPLLTAYLAAMLPTLAAAQRWHRLPALLAALMAAPQWNPSSAAGVAVVTAMSMPPRPNSGKGYSGLRSSSSTGAPGAVVTSLPLSTVQLQMGVISTVTVALSLSVQAAMAQALHPAAGQFLLGCGTPAAAMLCSYQRIALAVSQVAASGPGSEFTSAAAAAKQRVLACLEQLPLLRGYKYAPAESSAEGLEDGEEARGEGGAQLGAAPQEGDQAWWASGNVLSSINGVPQGPAAGGEVGACEPSLAEGRWSGELDAWRPPARLLPLVMGQVG